MTDWKKTLALLTLAVATASSLSAQDADAKHEYGSRGNLWSDLSDQERADVMELAERFKTMIGAARSELMMVKEAVRFAQERGFVEWDPSSSRPHAGDKFYAINRDRTMALWIVGKEPLSSGLRLINTHIDSVRLELKPHPLMEKKGTVLLDTLPHGGINAYQWTNVPLAITGRIDREDGSTIWLDVGLKDGDPIFLVPDLAPHVDKDLRKRPRSEAIEREELDPVLASAPPASDAPQKSVLDEALRIIEQQYGFEQDDWISADLQIVPALPPRDVGLDRSLLAAFGLDDRLTAITALLAFEQIGAPEHTAMAYLVTDEEVGSRWNVGASSEWFRHLLAGMIQAERGSVNELATMDTLAASQVVTADTTTATNPIWPAPQAPDNASLMHHGLVLKLYGPGRNANSEFVAHLRKLLDDANIGWQTHSYKEGYGGGTIASYFAGWNMEVTDWGVGIWSMHSPYEVASKADIWALYRGFVAFLGS